MVTPRCVRGPSPALALFLTVPGHYQHGPTRAAMLEKPPAKTVSYFHGILQEKPTGFVFPVRKLEFQSFQLSKCKQAHWLPPTTAHPGSGQPSLHTPGEAVRAAQALILLTNKPIFFPPVSEQKLHFPQLIQCYWSTLLPYKNHI